MLLLIKRAEVAILICEQINFKSKTVIGDRKNIK